MKSFLLILVAVCTACALSAQTESPKSKPFGSATAAPNIQKPQPLDPRNRDTSAKPQDDFFMYANGGWIKRTQIPPEYSRWGSFNELIENNNDALQNIAKKAEGIRVDPRFAPEAQKVSDYYASGMDEKAVDAAKAKPLDEEFKRIDAIKDRNDVLKAIAHLHNIGVGAFFGFTSGQDDKNSAMVIGQAFQGGLGMPDRDYYTKTDEASKKLREQYVAHVTKMLTLLGESESAAADHAKKIMTLETALAVPARTRVELRDPQKNYNKMTEAEMQQLMPDWKWAEYFKEINLITPGDVNVGQPDFFKAANGVFVNTSIDDWKAYLRWHLINATAQELSNDFVDEDFNFKERVLRGTEKIKPRWKRVIASTDDAIGEALGKLYVAFYFPPEAKERALELVNNLKEALADRIKDARVDGRTDQAGGA